MTDSSASLKFHITTSGCAWFSRHWIITSGSDNDNTPAYFVVLHGFFKPSVQIHRKDASGPVIGTVSFPWKPQLNITLTLEETPLSSNNEPQILETMAKKASLCSPYTVNLYNHNLELRRLNEGTKPFTTGSLKLIDLADGKVWAKFYSERPWSWDSIGRIEVLEHGLGLELVDAVVVVLLARIAAQGQER
jgi:hypothetical protein